MSIRDNTYGLSLVELLLYIAILGTLMGSIAVFFGMTSSARLRGQNISEVNQQGQYALDVIANSIRGATSITTPATGGTGTSLTIVVPTASLSPTVITITSGSVQIKEGAGASLSLTNSRVTASSFSVKNLTRANSKGTLQISFVLSRYNPSGRAEYSYSRTFVTSVSLRP